MGGPIPLTADPDYGTILLTARSWPVIRIVRSFVCAQVRRVEDELLRLLDARLPALEKPRHRRLYILEVRRPPRPIARARARTAGAVEMRCAI